MRFERIDLAPLVRGAACAALSGEWVAGLTVHVDVPALEVPVIGDAARLAQLIENLCANAVEHTPEGGSVHVYMVASGAEASVRVVDTGVEHDRESAGPALATSAAIVDGHGGAIAVGDGGQQGGTSVTVALPSVVEGAYAPDP
jgi:signal transduction histidine kinase